jgi:glutamate dehydrogenase (NAD(P)+)
MNGMMTISILGQTYKAHLVIDSIVNNASSGGVRIAEDLSLEEVAALAREMSLKYATFRLPRGGAKTGISIANRVPPEEKACILREIGWRLGPIIRTGVYSPGMDMNCGADDLRAIYAGAGIAIGKVTDTSFFTALSVENALEAWREELAFKGPVSVAIEGFGRVAGHLAARLPVDKYRIVAISTMRGAIRNRDGFDAALLSAKRNGLGDEVVNHVDGQPIDAKEVFTEPADVLLPSARTWVIDKETAGVIAAKAVVPIANAPYGDGAIARLHDRRIVSMPAHITNCGGVVASSLYDRGVDAGEVEMMMKRYFQPVVRQLLKLSKTLGVSPTELAERVGNKELDARRQRPLVQGRLARAGRRLQRYLPAFARRRIARRSFVENLTALGNDLESAAREYGK